MLLHIILNIFISLITYNIITYNIIIRKKDILVLLHIVQLHIKAIALILNSILHTCTTIHYQFAIHTNFGLVGRPAA